ncbi:MAG: hypothetical protein CR997_01040 [Acidobacteria bacterium]|nr:MAG: hypothetical protein CR997_01040 [Acidobacteriota bacterium]
MVLYFMLSMFMGERIYLEVYRPMGLSKVVYNENNGIMFCDTASNQIVYMSLSDRKRKILLDKGQGPNDVMSPTGIYKENGSIYIVELNFIKLYKLENNSLINLNSWKKSSRDMYFRQENYWIQTKFIYEKKGAKVLNYVFSHLDHIGEKLLVSTQLESLDKINPVLQPYKIQISNDNKAFVFDPNENVIKIWDLKEKKLTREFNAPIEPRMFDIKWGKDYLNKLVEDLRKQGIKFSNKPNFPDTLPVASNFFIVSENECIFQKFFLTPPKEQVYVCSDFNGDIITPEISPEIQLRTLLHLKNGILLIQYDKEKEDSYLEFYSEN